MGARKIEVTDIPSFMKEFMDMLNSSENEGNRPEDGFFEDGFGNILHDMVLRDVPEKKCVTKDPKVKDTVVKLPEPPSEMEGCGFLGRKIEVGRGFIKQGDVWVLRPFGESAFWKDFYCTSKVMNGGRLYVGLSTKWPEDGQKPFEASLNQEYDLPIDSDWESVVCNVGEDGALEFQVSEDTEIKSANTSYGLFTNIPDTVYEETLSYIPIESIGADELPKMTKEEKGVIRNEFVDFGDYFLITPDVLTEKELERGTVDVKVSNGMLIIDYEYTGNGGKNGNVLGVTSSTYRYRVLLPVDSDWGGASAVFLGKSKDIGVRIYKAKKVHGVYEVDIPTVN